MSEVVEMLTERGRLKCNKRYIGGWCKNEIRNYHREKKKLCTSAENVGLFLELQWDRVGEGQSKTQNEQSIK